MEYYMMEYNCQLDFKQSEDWLIILIINNNNSIFLPAISQVVQKIKIDSIEDSVLIPNQEIEHGIRVYIANTIASPENAFIRLLNTTNTDKVVSINKLNYESLSNYDVVQSSKENREKSVLSQVSKNFPPQFRTQLSTLCTQYSDVFGLETESLSTNNFYIQMLRLKDEEPVYIKNYRSPHSQKDETQAQVQKLIIGKIVEPSVSAYKNALLLVPKKSIPGSDKKILQLVIDYRQINKKLLSDKFRLPRIDDILDQLSRAKYFPCLDLL